MWLRSKPGVRHEGECRPASSSGAPPGQPARGPVPVTAGPGLKLLGHLPDPPKQVFFQAPLPRDRPSRQRMGKELGGLRPAAAKACSISEAPAMRSALATNSSAAEPVPEAVECTREESRATNGPRRSAPLHPCRTILTGLGAPPICRRRAAGRARTRDRGDRACTAARHPAGLSIHVE